MRRPCWCCGDGICRRWGCRRRLAPGRRGGLVRSRRAGALIERLEDAAGRSCDLAALETGVVLHAHPGEQRDLAAAQSRHAAGPRGRETRHLGSDASPAGGEELLDLCTVVHAGRVDPNRRRATHARGALPVHVSSGTSALATERVHSTMPDGHRPAPQLEGEHLVRATLMYGAGDVRVEDVPDPVIQEPTDAIVRVVRSCICGSDLHPYHIMPPDTGRRRWATSSSAWSRTSVLRCDLDEGRLRHRPVRLVRRHLRVLPRRPADLLRARRILGRGRIGGGQAEAVRVPLADGTLVELPVGADSALHAVAADPVRRLRHRLPRRRQGRRRPPAPPSR